MAKGKNAVIAQSGGPTPVINNSLRGAIHALKSYKDRVGDIYAGHHGIEGILKEELLDIGNQPEEEIELLRTTPASGSIGTCRYKLKEEQTEDLERVIEVFRAHDIGYFFYTGGNDSMDTASKISRLARERGLDLVVAGIPKTIDNDVGDQGFKLIDHTPGYGSVARYWTHMVQDANEENSGSYPSDTVLVLQAMGRKIGFIPAAARLADPKREMPLQIYMAEAGVGPEQILQNVRRQIKESKRALIVAGEGIDAGDTGITRDPFGHAQFSSSQTTVQQILVNYLNSSGIKARGQVPGTDQRSSACHISSVDLEEAYRLGQKAVETALEEGGGYMSTILRKPGIIYQVTYDRVPLEQVANSERQFPKEWLTGDRIDVTDDFVNYARPLIGDEPVSVPMVGGIMRFTRFRPVFAEKRCREYIPEAKRKER